jgi:small subunit ribosomal protein S19
MAKKEFTYRGHSPEQLKKMSIKEFALLLPSRERRTILRGLTDVEKALLRKLEKRDNVKTHAREMVIVPQMIGKTILVHNGKEYMPVLVNEEMVGYRFGEFVHTRKGVKHNSPGIGASASTKSVAVK